jgi:hypothetical protein
VGQLQHRPQRRAILGQQAVRRFWPTSDWIDALPTVSIVVPNLVNDMHDGSISQGDAWFWNNLSGYYR